ncbi:replication fork protection component Swi3-domain-containing protein [Thamnocephalis sphaerospora]|uniref:Chromosome segregation in meiosis protein n=1 Tax=Thamnocephalis sphaerospora TaxID=78915 RepID=A0A4P9XPV2_9FUNG|nr:replication fork protection component Swi3-domain-containing protein [Thamnocephalis sphaerospora]|eukprot:RKP08047.1 replication fork protection component Swi3-domain-containing protein [Thamnocephalis sphaerospora]
MDAHYSPLDDYALSDPEEQHGLASQNPAPEGSNEYFHPGADVPGGGDPAGAQPPKRRRAQPLPKLDAERLLSEEGLPLLKEQARKIRLAGKGHERSDLRKILSFYEKWAHQLYPRFGFEEFAMRAEAVCHTRRMQMALAAWRDEMRGSLDDTHADAQEGESATVGQTAQSTSADEVADALFSDAMNIDDELRLLDEAQAAEAMEAEEDEDELAAMYEAETQNVADRPLHVASATTKAAKDASMPVAGALSTARSPSPDAPLQRRGVRRTAPANKWLASDDEDEADAETHTNTVPPAKSSSPPSMPVVAPGKTSPPDEDDEDAMSDASLEL